MRITQRTITQNSLAGLNSNLAAVNKLQQQLTSGKTISRPSDSATGTNTSMLVRRDMTNTAQQARNISDGQSMLDATDSALQNMNKVTQTVRSLTVQVLNGGAMSAESRGAIATQVRGLRESLIGQANQVVQGRPLFGGVTSGDASYDSDGTYLGAGVGVGDVDGLNGLKVVPVNRQITDTENVRVDTTGPEAFGVGNASLFSVVKSIADHADAGDQAGLTKDLADLDTALSTMSTALASVGTRSARLDTAADVNTSRALTLKTQLSANEDVDLPKTIMELQMQQVGYQAALQATAQVLQPTLLDFLR